MAAIVATNGGTDVAASQPPAFRSDPWRFAALACFSLLSASNAMQWISYANIIDPVKEFFGVTSFAVNFLSLVYTIVYVIGAFFAATVLNYYGLKRGLLMASVLNVLGATLKLVSIAPSQPSFACLVISQICNSCAQLFFLGAPPSLASTWFSETGRTKATAVASMANNVGIAMGLLLPPVIITPGNEGRQAFLVLFGFHFAVVATELLLSTCVVPEKPRWPPSLAAAVAAQEHVKNSFAGVHHEHHALIHAVEPSHGDKLADGSQVNSLSTVGAAAAEVAHPIARQDEPVASSHTACCASASDFAQGMKVTAVSVKEGLQHHDYLGWLSIGVGLSLASMWSLSTVILQVLTPFGISATSVGAMGSANILVGTVCANIAGYFVDKYRTYRWPLAICYIVSALSIAGVTAVAWSAIGSASPSEKANIDVSGGVVSVSAGTSAFIFALYVVLGIAQNCAVPIAFEFAVEISFPLEEATSGTLLMLGGNFGAMVLIGSLMGLLGNSPSPRQSGIALIIVLAVAVGSAVIVSLVRASLKRLATEQNRA